MATEKLTRPKASPVSIAMGDKGYVAPAPAPAPLAMPAPAPTTGRSDTMRPMQRMYGHSPHGMIRNEFMRHEYRASLDMASSPFNIQHERVLVMTVRDALEMAHNVAKMVALHGMQGLSHHVLDMTGGRSPHVRDIKQEDVEYFAKRVQYY